jgi:ATP synthase delta (OSCP) subunit
MSYKLPVTVYTLDQMQLGAVELHAYANRLHQQAATRHADAGQHKPVSLSIESQALLDELPPKKQTDPEAIDALATELEEMVAHGPRVSLTLAGLASHHLREELVGWLRTNLKANLLVDFHVNPDIAGGLMVRTTNHVYDFSFRRHLLEDTARFTRIFDRV